MILTGSAELRLLSDSPWSVNIKYSKEAYKVYRETSSNRKARIEIIKNGGHGFSREIDKIAKEILNDFMVS